MANLADCVTASVHVQFAIGLLALPYLGFALVHLVPASFLVDRRWLTGPVLARATKVLLWVAGPVGVPVLLLGLRTGACREEFPLILGYLVAALLLMVVPGHHHEYGRRPRLTSRQFRPKYRRWPWRRRPGDSAR